MFREECASLSAPYRGARKGRLAIDCRSVVMVGYMGVVIALQHVLALDIRIA